MSAELIMAFPATAILLGIAYGLHWWWNNYQKPHYEKVQALLKAVVDDQIEHHKFQQKIELRVQSLELTTSDHERRINNNEKEVNRLDDELDNLADIVDKKNI